MNQDFRVRVFVPLMMPLGALAAFGLFAFSLSRVLLAISAVGAVFVALLVAGYVLVLAAMVAARPHVSTQALGIGLVVAMVGVTAAGAAGAAAGIRPIEHEEEEEEAGAEEEGEEDAGLPEDALVFVAMDIEFSEAPETAEAGEVTIGLDNQGSADHDVTIEELGDEVVVEAAGGETATGTVDLEPGTYTYYCSVPGHRSSMEGTLEVQ